MLFLQPPSFGGAHRIKKNWVVSKRDNGCNHMAQKSAGPWVEKSFDSEDGKAPFQVLPATATFSAFQSSLCNRSRRRGTSWSSGSRRGAPPWSATAPGARRSRMPTDRGPVLAYGFRATRGTFIWLYRRLLLRVHMKLQELPLQISMCFCCLYSPLVAGMRVS